MRETVKQHMFTHLTDTGDLLTCKVMTVGSELLYQLVGQLRNIKCSTHTLTRYNNKLPYRLETFIFSLRLLYWTIASYHTVHSTTGLITLAAAWMQVEGGGTA